MKKRLGLVLSLLLFSCDPVVRRVVTLTFDAPGENVTIEATTTVDHNPKPGTPEFAEAEEARAALRAERDDWSLRFAQAAPIAERVTFERSEGKIDSVDRRATVKVDDLQKFFYDTPVTITTTRGEGWIEMAVYAGASMRASPAQRRLADKVLAAYTGRAARYFEAVRTLYAYLDEKPQRAEPLFFEVFRDDNDEPMPMSDRERSATADVRQSLDALLDTDNIEPGVNFDRLFDLVYNPFPAECKVIVKAAVLGAEGFEKVDSETFAIRTSTALEAVGALEGRWISPDPLAVFARSGKGDKASTLAASLAREHRHADPVVTRSELAAALVEKMRPAPRYRLRWVTKAGPAS